MCDACSFSPLCSLPESIIVAFAFLLHGASVATSVQIFQTNAFPPDHQHFKKMTKEASSVQLLPTCVLCLVRGCASHPLPGIACAASWGCPGPKDAGPELLCPGFGINKESFTTSSEGMLGWVLLCPSIQPRNELCSSHGVGWGVSESSTRSFQCRT